MPAAYSLRVGNSGMMYVRTAGSPASVVSSIRRAIDQEDGSLFALHVRTLEQVTTESLAQERLLAGLSGILAAATALLAAIGLYGVIAYSVLQRSREIGIRLALGAMRGNVLWLVLREVLMLVSTGVALGVPSALGTC
jgi:ABC-type antimicrobial peptide transport system permease subunit